MKNLLLTGIRHIKARNKTDRSWQTYLDGINGRHSCCRRYTSPIFGRTLEVSIVPSKACPFDCIYCGHGLTTRKTVDYIPNGGQEEILNSVNAAILDDKAIDHIVIAGEGDPALNGEASSIIHKIKRMTRSKVAVVSCGGLLWKQKVQNELSGADLIMASLDAHDKTLYQCINRPHGMVPFTRFFNGMIEFRRKFEGGFWLMVTFLDGMNAVELDARKIAGLVERLDPDRTFIRAIPGKPVENFAFPVEHSRLQQLSGFFGKNAVVVDQEEIVTPTAIKHDGLPLGMHD